MDKDWPTREQLGEALKWAVQWCPNPVDVSPPVSEGIFKVLIWAAIDDVCFANGAEVKP